MDMRMVSLQYEYEDAALDQIYHLFGMSNEDRRKALLHCECDNALQDHSGLQCCKNIESTDVFLVIF